jgi:DNA-binding winged helix-turn-helix (wHTH) protein
MPSEVNHNVGELKNTMSKPNQDSNAGANRSPKGLSSILIFSQQAILLNLIAEIYVNYKIISVDIEIKKISADLLHNCQLVIIDQTREVDPEVINNLLQNEYIKLKPRMILAIDSSRSFSYSSPHLSGLSERIYTIKKPLYINFLTNLIDIVLRNQSQELNNISLNNNYILYPELRLITRIYENQVTNSANLTSKEMMLLQYLHLAKGQSVTKAELLDKIWGYKAITQTHTLETHIYRIKQKINAGQDLIASDAKGYRLVL